jgi:hypothetical protein
VAWQNPNAGTKVPKGSAVDLALSQVMTGVSKATLLDALPNGSVYVWLYDSSTIYWYEQNNGGLLSAGDSVTISFGAKQLYVVAAVDPSINDPRNIDSVKWEQTFLGDPSGPTYTGNMT